MMPIMIRPRPAVLRIVKLPEALSMRPRKPIAWRRRRNQLALIARFRQWCETRLFNVTE